jgi:hypothetical protein
MTVIDMDDRRARVTATLGSLAEILRADGATLTVDDIDAAAPSVRVSVALDDVDCHDCVMPPDRLRDTIAAALERDLGTAVRVVLDDPRAVVAATTVAMAGVTRFTVLDPTGIAADDGPADTGPDAGPLDGKVVAIRRDVLWPAFDWTVEEWTAQFEAAGATVVTFARAQGEKDDVLAVADARWSELVAGADLAVSGLANCGSCTSWSVRDALGAAAVGIATTVVATAHFESLAHLLAADGGRAGLRVTVLPYPYSTLDEATVRDHARREFAQLLDVLGATAAVPA